MCVCIFVGAGGSGDGAGMRNNTGTNGERGTRVRRPGFESWLQLFALCLLAHD